MGAESVGPHRGVVLGEVMAWRHWAVTWEVHAPRLISLSQRYVWLPGSQEASGVPAEGNDVGFYALKTHGQALEYIGVTRSRTPPHVYGRLLGYALGAVDLWGDVVEGEIGYRAQFARVALLVCLIHPKYGSTFRNTSTPHPQQMAEVQFSQGGELMEALRRFYCPVTSRR